MSEQDNIYQTPLASVPDFEFDQAVARVFPDMIKRSVPGYAETVAMSGIIAGRYAQAGSNLYDLGCSLGAVTLAMRNALDANQLTDCTLIGIDNSDSMIEQAGHYLALDSGQTPVTFECADVTSMTMSNASVTALNFVLQFIALEERFALLEKIAQATLPGGALILSEKLKFADDEQQIQDTLHQGFKRAKGYSDLEIAQKRAAIENVLIPETEEAHLARLKQAGFSKVIRWYQCFNFASYLAIK